MPGRITTILFTVLALVLLAPAPGQAGERFTDNGDGTLTDHELNIVWSAADNEGDVNWQDAGRWARFTFPSTLSGQGEGWRMPTLKELESLYTQSKYDDGYEAACGTRVRIAEDFELSCAWVWAVEEAGVTARLYDFRRGRAYKDRKAKHRGYRALAVRPLKAGE